MTTEFPIPSTAISPSVIRSGIVKGKAPARLELTQSSPAILIDAAHNEPSVRAFIDALRSELPKFRQRIALISISRDKSIDQMVELLTPHFDRIICTRFIANPRACDPNELAEAVHRAAKKHQDKNTPKIEVFDHPELAWQAIRRDLGKDDLLCVAGSFFIAAEMLDLIGRPKIASP